MRHGQPAGDRLVRKLLEISRESVLPSVASVLSSQSVPDTVTPDDRTYELVAEAAAVFQELAAPSGLIAEVSIDEFKEVFAGEGNNDPQAVLADIFPQADRLALFAVTVGDSVSQEITRLFEAGEFPLGSMLDSTASEAAELAARQAEDTFARYTGTEKDPEGNRATMGFSPGYCGWDVSGQKKLFSCLEPKETGITLTESYLMTPLKSVSGVIVAGPTELFDIDDSYPYCADCETHSCRQRYEAISRS